MTANQPIFATVISTIEHLTKDVMDFQTAKLAFSVLTRMVFTWGGPDLQLQRAAIGDGDQCYGNPQPKLPGFDRFMMIKFSPTCWAMPSNPAFDPKDAQGKQVLSEAAALQKAIYNKTGQEYLSWLRNTELSGMGMDGGTIEEYLRTLCTSDTKEFQRFFKVGTL